MDNIILREKSVITVDNQGPLLAIATEFALTIMALAVVTKIALNLTIRRILRVEDFLIITTLAFGIGQSIAILVAISNGLGQRKAHLSADSITSVESAQYAASLLFISTIGLAKLSILQLLTGLIVEKTHIRIVRATMYAVVAWTVPNIFVLAFQCGAFQPWNTESGQCINQVRLFASFLFA